MRPADIVPGAAHRARRAARPGPAPEPRRGPRPWRAARVYERGYGSVLPATGRTEWLLLPRVNRAHFARAVGAGPTKRVVLAPDQAGWHTAGEVRVPEGLHPAHVPAHTPALQPARRLWPLCNEGLANRLFATIAALEETPAR